MNMSTLRQSEPLILRGAIVAAVTALIHVGVVLGLLPIDADQESAIAGAVDLVGTAVLVVWSRGAVTPVAHGSSEGVIHEAVPEEPESEYTEDPAL